MKRQTKTKNRKLWRRILLWLRRAAKFIRAKWTAAGKSTASLPDEAPH